MSGFGGQFTVSGSYTYTENGLYTVTVTITAVNGAESSAVSSAKVGDLFAGLQSTLTVASFVSSDPNATASQFAVTVLWGDGSAPDNTAHIIPERRWLIQRRRNAHLRGG